MREDHSPGKNRLTSPETPKEVSRGETPKTEKFIGSVIENHKLNNVEDFGHYFDLAGKLSDLSRMLERENQQLQLRAERAEVTVNKINATTGYWRGRSDVKSVEDLVQFILQERDSLQSKLAVAEQEINKQKAVTATMDDLLKEQAKMIDTLSQQNQELREALQPFTSGISILPWGKIKALLPVELAKQITKHNLNAGKALSSTTPSTDWVKKCDVLELKGAIDEYIALLLAELHEVVPIAHVHGWASTRFDAGEKCRAKIAEITKKHLGETQSLLATHP